MFENHNKILLIEDDLAIANSLVKGLEREGFKVVWKEDGFSGIDYASTGHPDLIILDVRLPDISGFDVCKKMRVLKMIQPILILTVRSDEVDKVLGLEIGADDYMTKPFSIRELISRVRALLRRAYGELSSTQSDVMYVSDLVIDLAKGQTWRGDQLVRLTPTEFRILQYLAQHPEQAISRVRIIEAVWGQESEYMDERAVNVNIRRLREKIEDDPGKPKILLTVPGIGYRLKK